MNRICALIILAITIAFFGVMGAGYYTNGFESAAPLYAITADGEVIDKNADFNAGKERELTVRVKTAGFKNYTTPEYTVHIVSVGEFEYTVDGTPYKWTAGEDLTNELLISQNGGEFTIAVLSFSEYLTLKYPESECTHDMAEKPFYSVVITSGNDEISFNLIKDISVDGVEVNPDEVIFS